MDLLKFISNWETTMTEPNLNILVEQSIDKDYVKEQWEAQLEQGLKPNNESFEEYSPATIAIKRQTGGFISPSGNISLKDTGSWFSSAVVKREQDGTTFLDNTDGQLTSDLTQRFGDVILDVPIDDRADILEDTQKKLEEKINKELYK